MSYVLDGIETAMEETREQAHEGSKEWLYGVKCPCSWSYYVGASSHGEGRPYLPDIERSKPALRFHYTHCPKAKPLVDYGVIRNAANAPRMWTAEEMARALEEESRRLAAERGGTRDAWRDTAMLRDAARYIRDHLSGPREETSK